MPTYKDQQEQLREKDLATYGFLGYPLLQSADILVYKATAVPVGEDQVAHVEITREVARRFNHFYGVEPDFIERAEEAIKKMGKKNARVYRDLRRRYQEQGEHEALDVARALLDNQQNITLADRERLHGYLDGTGRNVLPEPQALLTPHAKMPGLDGRKMSKSYNNFIGLREDAESVRKKVRTMQTDPARVRRTDPGNPENARFGTFTSSTPVRLIETGSGRAAPPRVSAASTARCACSRVWKRNWGPSASGAMSSRTTWTPCAVSSTKGARPLAARPARPWTKCAMPWG